VRIVGDRPDRPPRDRSEIEGSRRSDSTDGAAGETGLVARRVALDLAAKPAEHDVEYSARTKEGGVVTTEAGTDPNVVGLVYIAAFIPDTGESALTLATETPAAAIGDIEVTADGLFLLFNEANFPADFAGDVPVVHSQFMARSQVLLSLAAFEAPVTVPAWRSKPSWALVASNDRVINPDQELALAERAGSRIIAVPSSHVAYISHPIAVAGLIEAASTGSTP
jgi:hypothetical protein